MIAPRPILTRLSAWWRRSITVERAHPDFDVTRVRIDPGDGTAPSELILSRIEAFRMAASCRAIQPRWRGEAITLYVDRAQPDGSVESSGLDVPPWAWPAVGDRLQQHAAALGWRGECLRPAARQAYR